ncbi:MAG TPA: tetratricopeptide repeat protein [Myxococcota bacterium]|nr:tetratricopeptide repeat protein [Myxococcota bacterium]HRY93262.1 tetratricopeptide repeat protein [Myxococcota bacterium]HSA19956.1 tetratricopeptide repeat protein [Myxococcota bacterium]
MPCPDENQTLAFVEGRLPEGQARQVEEHLDACPACRALVADLAREAAPGQGSGPADPEATRPDLGQAGAGPALRRGSEVGRYVILDLIGRGGMGEVYAAYDTRLDRKVALKFLHQTGPGSSRRLLDEAHAMARVRHPNAVTVYDVGDLAGQVFVSMEHVEGQSLAAWLAAERRTWQAVRSVFLQAGAGLAAVHRAGLVHRDFKPANVLVAADGRVLVTDFGLARPALGDPAGSGGTPAYMAPEQRAGGPADARSDQFAFCVALWEGLHGERPLQGGALRPPADPGRAPAWLRTRLLRGLQPEPAARYPSVDELLSALARDPRRARRRLAAALLGLGLLLAGGVGAYAALGGRPAPCQGAAERLAGVWDEGRARAVEAAFLGSGAPSAPQAFAASRRVLDGYAADWARERTGACEATRVRGEQSEELLDLRMQCLEERLTELKALAELFLAADAAVVERSTEAAQSLSSLAGCARAASLRAQVPPPAEPDRQAALRSLRSRLAAVKAGHEAGRSREVLAEAEAVLTGGQALGHPPLTAEAGYWLAEILARLDRPDEARAVGLRAAGDALAGRHLALLVRAFAGLVQRAGPGREGAAQGPVWLELARAGLAALGPEPELEVLLLRAEGQWRFGQREYRQAVEVLEAARARSLEVYGPTHLRTAQVLVNLAGALGQLGGRLEREIELKQAALAVLERAYGRAHPEVAGLLASIGRAYWRAGRAAEGRPFLEEALGLQERLLGPEHTQVAATHEALGAVLGKLGELDAELAHRQRALDIRAARVPADDASLATCREGLGLALERQGRHAEAQAQFERALTIAEKAFGPASQEVAFQLLHLGQSRVLQGRPAEALAPLEQALALRQAAVAAQGELYLANPHQALGRALLALGRPAEALEHFREALAIVERAPEPPAANRAVYLCWLGLALLALDRPGEALAPFEEAVRVQASLQAYPPELADSRFGLARALAASGGDRARATELAGQARETFARFAARRADLLAVERWLATAGRGR